MSAPTRSPRPAIPRTLVLWAAVASATVLVLASASMIAAYYHSAAGSRLIWSYEMYRAEVLQDLGPPTSEEYQRWSKHYERQRALHVLALQVLDKGRYVALASGLLLLLSVAGVKFTRPVAAPVRHKERLRPDFFARLAMLAKIVVRNLGPDPSSPEPAGSPPRLQEDPRY